MGYKRCLRGSKKKLIKFIFLHDELSNGKAILQISAERNSVLFGVHFSKSSSN